MQTFDPIYNNFALSSVETEAAQGRVTHQVTRFDELSVQLTWTVDACERLAWLPFFATAVCCAASMMAAPIVRGSPFMSMVYTQVGRL